MRASGMRTVLVLHGPAQLRSGKERVRLRTKGLALLCILALDGPTRRERVADLLWDQFDAANNLRVELHRLRGCLASIGVHAFPAGLDPLELPPEIEVDRTPRAGAGQPLEGLDDLSEHFQAWLEAQRSLLALDPGGPRLQLRQQLVEEVARRVVQPYVLVLKGSPGTGRHEFAKALAGRLGLPVVEAVQAAAPALHIIEAAEADAEQVAHHVLRQSTGVWALTETAFGRESALLLLLRNLFPPERMRFIELGGLPWHEARSLVLSGLAFEEAARLYVTTGGHIGYMRELLKVRPQRGFGCDTTPLPQRIRAGYLLEARRLPDATRAVLELLSVHPAALPDSLLARQGFTEHLDALEEAGWLRFDGGWSYRDAVSRSVLYKSLQEGRKAHYHAKFAAAFEESDGETAPAATFHRFMATRNAASGGLPSERATAFEPTDPSAAGNAGTSAPPRLRVKYGRELALLLERHSELHAAADDEWWYWSRHSRDTRPSFAAFTLPEGPCLIRLEARWHAERVFGFDGADETYPLRLEFCGGRGRERQVLFRNVTSGACLDDGTLLLPDRSAWFTCDHRTLLVESRLEAGIVEFRLRAFEHGSAYGIAEAYDLAAAPAITASTG